MALDFPAMAAWYSREYPHRALSPDEARTRYLTMRAAMWKSDDRLFFKDCVRIRTKEGDLAPLVLNEAQHILRNAAEAMLKDEQWVRLAGLKGRRQGFSTMVAARGYWRATLWDRQTYIFCRTK